MKKLKILLFILSGCFFLLISVFLLFPLSNPLEPYDTLDRTLSSVKNKDVLTYTANVVHYEMNKVQFYRWTAPDFEYPRLNEYKILYGENVSDNQFDFHILLHYEDHSRSEWMTLYKFNNGWKVIHDPYSSLFPGEQLFHTPFYNFSSSSEAVDVIFQAIETQDHHALPYFLVDYMGRSEKEVATIFHDFFENSPSVSYQRINSKTIEVEESYVFTYEITLEDRNPEQVTFQVDWVEERWQVLTNLMDVFEDFNVTSTVIYD
ncbi:hypothetical protein [Alkalihalobacillus pseudalcaliphilus]|uniref:hypothetical protein n=1 Tax=Alkalihalobacillus pseudalcaliphilus TaxID=79884 RepID=UPI00064DBB9A|nr:hypothetical protein [Alkalihalobacillus pseudalcaliphilus]KMK75844.1 hypothetical protein AB990_11315 [Alkalihalobacillus pseudalcaliphilus]